MTITRYGLVAGLLLCMAFGTDDHNYPQDYFDLPVNRPIKLSGTFGELRSSHFHAGIDIKTLNGRPGEKIYASAPGYVARIKVSPFGYGNALYIAHPNGYTTVYAHLDRFIPEVAAYVKNKQYELRRFAVDLHPRADQFPVFQGQHIGYLGNTGGSFGPHLHFEIRRSADQVPVNPFLFGLPVQDQVRPQMQSLKVYYLNEDLARMHTQTYPIKAIGPGQFVLGEALHEGAWRVSFGLQAFDQMNGVPNRNGIYALEMAVDGERQYAFTMDDIPFTKSRYLNAHVDYAAKHHREGSFHRCYRVPGNALDIYEERNSKGVVALYAERPRTITLTARDIHGNKSELSFEITRDTNMYENGAATYDYIVGPDRGLSIRNDDIRVEVPAEAFYEYATVDYRLMPDTSGALFAPLHDIGSPTIPLHRSGSIAVRHDALPSTWRDKAFVARITAEGELINCGGVLEGNFIRTRSRDLGIYSVSIDTIPPRISPVRFGSDMSQARSMQFRITDSQPIGGSARGLTYHASVNGQWILMEYDAKNDLLTHYFDERIPAGRHEFRLTVTDDRNNSAVFSAGFSR